MQNTGPEIVSAEFASGTCRMVYGGLSRAGGKVVQLKQGFQKIHN